MFTEDIQLVQKMIDDSIAKALVKKPNVPVVKAEIKKEEVVAEEVAEKVVKKHK